MSKIERLTPEQEALVPVWHQRWLEIGMDERPIDRELATSAIGRAYATINRPAPAIIFCASPATSNLGIAAWPRLMKRVPELEDSLGASLWASLRDSLGASLASTYFGGQYDSPWVAFYLFCAEIGVKYKPDAKPKLEIVADLCKSCGWIYFYEKICFVSGRPKVKTVMVQRNNGWIHVLHCVDGPAMSFADGWRIYAWRGVRIPAKYYLKTVSAKSILSEPNAEIRRALMERYDHLGGKGQFLLDCGAKVLDTSVQPMRDGNCDSINELLAIDLPDDPDLRMVALRVIDPSTGRQYIIRVPPDQTTVQGALAWSFNVAPDKYRLLQET